MKNICVYCGSRKPGNENISRQARLLGEGIASRNWSIVYGGGKVGMMGIVADGALEKGGDVIGVIPTHLKEKEVAHLGLTKLHETQDMHTRKALMESLSDAFVVLPGGFGTLDEFFEILTWRQLGIHRKPIFLINIDGYFDGLMQFVKGALSEDFIRDEAVALFSVVQSVDECFEMLEL
ncbi:MAG: TIGR00730 family Rossman fold protein [Balneola sp.]